VSKLQDEVRTTYAADSKEPIAYVINLYTSVADRQDALDLAVRVSDVVAAIDEVDRYATTVSLEVDPQSEPVPAYLNLVTAPEDRA
jgi:hypothetical protein